MNEIVFITENKEKLPPRQTLLVAEPIFGHPDEDKNWMHKVTVPLGQEEWVENLTSTKLDEPTIEKNFMDEYLAIIASLKEIGVPFRVIVSHRKLIDETFVAVMLTAFRIRGLSLNEALSSTCFPRDMMVDFDGKAYINPEANFNFPDNSGRISPLGEGGRVLRQGRKVFVPDQRGYVQSRKRFVQDLQRLHSRFQIGFLPHPLAIELDTRNGSRKVFTNDHLDRTAALIVGKDGKDYLVLDEHYVNESYPPYGDYWNQIQRECRKLGVIPIVLERGPGSIPYAINLEQFFDGTVLCTGEDFALKVVLGQIVGLDKIKVTNKPIIFYPIFRQGGIRCMLLFAPEKIVGEPVVRR